MSTMSDAEELACARYRRGWLYDDPESYDLDYAGYLAELPFYRLVAERFSGGAGAMVELGAGTGRLTLALARLGVRLHAVEPADAMVSMLRRKLALEEREVRARVSVEQATATTFAGPRDSTCHVVILPFNTVLHLDTHEALALTFDHVRDRLAPGGCFSLDLTAPPWLRMSVDESAFGPIDQRVCPRTGNTVLTCDRTRYEPEHRRLRSELRMLPKGSEDGVERWLTQRVWTWQQILRALEVAGFEPQLAFGDVDLRPFEERSPRLLIAALRR